jgi:hypothetical protein
LKIVKLTLANAARSRNAARSINAYGTDYIDEGDRIWVVSEKKKGTVKSFTTTKGPQPIITVKYDDGSVGVADAKDIRVIPNSLRSRNAVVQKALNAALPVGGMGASDSTILWRMIDGGKDEPYHDEYQSRLDRMNQKNITEDTVAILKKYGYRFKNADTSVLRETAVNGAGYVDASTVVIRPGDAVVFKTGYRSHSNDDDWLERNGDTVREVRGDEVKIGPSANDWAKIKDLMVWHNSRTTNAVVAKALNVSHKRRS